MQKEKALAGTTSHTDVQPVHPEPVKEEVEEEAEDAAADKATAA